MPSASRSSVAQLTVDASQLNKAHKICQFVGLEKVTTTVCVFYEKRRLKNGRVKSCYSHCFHDVKYFFLKAELAKLCYFVHMLKNIWAWNWVFEVKSNYHRFWNCVRMEKNACIYFFLVSTGVWRYYLFYLVLITYTPPTYTPVCCSSLSDWWGERRRRGEKGSPLPLPLPHSLHPPTPPRGWKSTSPHTHSGLSTYSHALFVHLTNCHFFEQKLNFSSS